MRKTTTYPLRRLCDSWSATIFSAAIYLRIIKGEMNMNMNRARASAIKHGMQMSAAMSSENPYHGMHIQ